MARELFRLVPEVRLTTFLMIGIGIAAGLAETVGITLLVAALFSLANPDGTVTVLSSLQILSGFDETASSRGLVVTILLVALSSKIILTLVNGVWNARVSHAISESIRNQLYDQLLDISLQDVSRHDRGELITILATESYEVAGAHTAIVRTGINVSTIVLFGGVLLATSWQIALIAIFAGVLHSLAMSLFANSYHRLGRATSIVLEQLTRISWSSLQAFKAVRAFGVEEVNRQTFRELSRQAARSLAKSEIYNQITGAISEAMVFAVLFAIVLAPALLDVPFASVVGATVLLFRMQPHIREFNRNLLLLIKADVPLERIRSVITRDDKDYVTGGDYRIETVRFGIEFRGVGFHYRGAERPCLSNINFSIPVGSRTAIIGRSGSGKTTLVNLLLGLERPTSGKILVDGVDLSTLRRADWVRLVSIAGQDVELIEGTISENIRFHRSFDEKDIRAAANLAGADRYINFLPDGYDEWAGDEAIRLSGGQRQRLSVARGLVGLPEILVLDEATSGLDEETEEEVLRAVIERFRDRTIVLITHRRSTLRFMDNFIEINDPTRASSVNPEPATW
ncbi:ATP-binding cassette domain-containing protein [Chthonobacter rhizosphaerae]|uniref:ATP-binding cassette domain-containing protein n=1 Tax=Chthonobacter rhizosphaerae TaxID=2735553 RepID=UPI0015EEC946